MQPSSDPRTASVPHITVARPRAAEELETDARGRRKKPEVWNGCSSWFIAQECVRARTRRPHSDSRVVPIRSRARRTGGHLLDPGAGDRLRSAEGERHRGRRRLGVDADRRAPVQLSDPGATRPQRHGPAARAVVLLTGADLRRDRRPAGACRSRRSARIPRKAGCGRILPRSRMHRVPQHPTTIGSSARWLAAGR